MARNRQRREAAPQRLTGKRRMNSVEVQGPGSWVEFKPLKVGEMRDLRERRAEDPDFDDFEAGVELLETHILGWNWVDEDGKPLPSPSEQPEVIDDLTSEEIEFLSALIAPEVEAKN